MRNRVLGMSLDGGKEDGIGGKGREDCGESRAVRKRRVESRVKVLEAESSESDAIDNQLEFRGEDD